MQAESESDDEEQQIYNPLKLPMGWDGKPIPYWLYKLHGLGQVVYLRTRIMCFDHMFPSMVCRRLVAFCAGIQM